LQEVEETENEENQLSETANSSEQSSSATSPAPEPRTFPASKKKRVEKEKQSLCDSLNNAVEILKQVAQRSEQSSNEFTQFGLYVASQLETLPLREAIRLQSDIQALITSVRMRHLSHPTPSTPEGNTDENLKYLNEVERNASTDANEDVQDSDEVRNSVQEIEGAPTETAVLPYTHFTNWSLTQL